MMALLYRSLFGGAILSIYRGDHTSLGMEVDPYYSAIDFYITPFGSTNKDPPLDESAIYGELLKRFFVPRMIYFETSLYPAAIVGNLVRTNFPTFYQDLTLGSNFNFVKLFTAKYSQPWAFSFFLGNYIPYRPSPPSTNEDPLFLKPFFPEGLSPFFPEEMAQREGTACSGILTTFGPDLLLNNVFYTIPWTEIELTVKGKVATTQKMLMWHFRFGFRGVFLQGAEPILYMGISRDRTDFNDTRLSIWKNTRFDLRIDKGFGANNFWRFALTLGKNFPLKRTRFALSFALGFEANINSPYPGGFDVPIPFHIIFQPGFRF